MPIVCFLVGVILGMILTAIGYHRWFVEYNDTIDDLKGQVRGKDMVISSLKEHYKSEVQKPVELKTDSNGQEK